MQPTNIINLNQPVASVVEAQPELLELLADFGFKPLKNPAMRQSVGRIVTLNQGIKLIGKNKEDLVQMLVWNGYQVEEGD